jgi:hypothetical protein
LELARFEDDQRQVKAIRETIKLGRHPKFEDVRKVVNRLLGFPE